MTTAFPYICSKESDDVLTYPRSHNNLGIFKIDFEEFELLLIDNNDPLEIFFSFPLIFVVLQKFMFSQNRRN